MKDIG